MTSAGVSTETTYTYQGLTLLSLAASDSAGATWSVTYLTDGSGRPYAGVYSSSDASQGLFAITTTERGDVVGLVDGSGTPIAAYRYDAYGRPTLATSTPEAAALASRQPLRYASYLWDAESGTYYLSARSYDPVSCQFLSRDPARADGEESAYQYCGGDPVGGVDPSGEWGLQVHLHLTKSIATSLRLKSGDASRIAYWDWKTDSAGQRPPSQYPKYHWCIDGAAQTAHDEFETAKRLMAQGKPRDKVRQRLGWVLHCVQDIVGHDRILEGGEWRYYYMNPHIHPAAASTDTRTCKWGCRITHHRRFLFIDCWVHADEASRTRTRQNTESWLRAFKKVLK